MAFVIDQTDEIQVQATLMAINDELGCGTSRSTREKMDSVKILQNLDENLSGDASTL